MPNKTPLEQYIAETGGDRRATYERNMREKGNRKLTVWVPNDVAVEVRALCSALVHCDDAKLFTSAVRDLAKAASAETAE